LALILKFFETSRFQCIDANGWETERAFGWCRVLLYVYLQPYIVSAVYG